jgi:hypothetical protein
MDTSGLCSTGTKLRDDDEDGSIAGRLRWWAHSMK